MMKTSVSCSPTKSLLIRWIISTFSLPKIELTPHFTEHFPSSTLRKHDRENIFRAVCVVPLLNEM